MIVLVVVRRGISVELALRDNMDLFVEAKVIVVDIGCIEITSVMVQ